MSDARAAALPLKHVPRVRWGRVAAGVCALALSALIHGVVLERFPDLPIGRLADGPLERIRQPLRLGDVRLREAPRFERPPPLDLKTPERVERLADTAREAAASQPPALPLPHVVPREEMAGAQRAAAVPDLTFEREAWEPRRDLLHIDSPVREEKVASLPRRLVSPPDLTAAAPPIDQVLARALDDLPVRPEAAAGGPARLPPAAPAAGRLAAASVPLPAVDFGEVPAPAWAAETAALAKEAAGESEAAPFEPVEQWLALNLRTHRPADEPEVTYFELRIARASEDAMPVLPKDVVFLQDCSESMTQRKVNACKAGLREFVEALGPEDRMELISFRDGTQSCFGELRAVTSHARAEARSFIDRLAARGKTDVDAGLHALQALPRDPGRPLLVVLMTDGRPTTGTVNSSKIIESFTRSNAGRISVFTVGAGRQANRFLLDLLSYRNRGGLEFVDDNADIPRALRRMQEGLSRPVLTDLRFRFSGIAEEEVYPRTLTHLYLDRPLVVYGRFAGAGAGAAIQVVGRSGPEPKDMVFPLDWSAADPAGDEVRRAWAWQKIYDLIGEHLQTGRQEALDEVHALADRYGLHVPYARDEVYF